MAAIGTADADGSHINLVTNRECTEASTSQCTDDTSPVWSPNGQRIAFVRMKPSFLPLDGSLGFGPNGPTGVYTVHPDGTDITQVSTCGSQCRITSPQWAPDGHRLAYVGSAPGLHENDTMTSSIDVANTTTGTVNVLPLRTHTSQPDEDWIAPAITWAPSGQHLAVVAHLPDTPTTLYTVRLHHATMSSLAPIRNGAYPPLAWLPTPQ